MQMVRMFAEGVILATCAASVQAETLRLQVQNAVVAKAYQTEEDAVNVTLTPDGRRGLARFTSSRVGCTIHLRVDDVLLTSATLGSPLVGGELQLSPGVTGFGGMSAQEIDRRLDAGRTLEISDDK